MSLRGRVSAWWEERIGIDWDRLRELTNEPVPYHLKRWWFALGGTVAILFGIQVASGILLAFYYVPTPDKAYESVAYINNVVPFGWLVRGVHRTASALMVVVLILHAVRVFFTCAYRRPRELNWMVGVLLLLCVLGLGFTGYSLVFEQLSYWAATVGANIAGTVPVVGPWVADLLRGGPEVGAATLTRFFVIHVWILPFCVVGLILVHIALVRAHGVTPLAFKNDPPEAKPFKFFPDHFYTEIIIAFLIVLGVFVFAILAPPEMGPRADPLVTPEHIKPEWYFYFTFRWLKLTNLKMGVISLNLAVLVLLFWPFIDRLLERGWPGRDVSVWIGVVGFAFTLVLTVWEALA